MLQDEDNYFVRRDIKIHQLIYQALCNERKAEICLQNELNFGLGFDQMSNFKIIKLGVWQRRLGILFYPAVVISSLIIPFTFPAKWLYALFLSAALIRMNSSKHIQCFHTLNAHTELIRATIQETEHALGCVDFSPLMRVSNISRKLKPFDILRCIKIQILLYFKILMSGKHMRLDLMLHAYDSFELAMFATYVARSPDKIFVTTSHYQRWPFLASHLTNNLWVMQHGDITNERIEKLDFEHPFGTVACFFSLHEKYDHILKQIYSIKKIVRMNKTISLMGEQTQHLTVFIASSAPYLKSEIEFTKALRKVPKVRILLKLHPAHTYGSSVKILKSISDELIDADRFPNCNLMVSYNSSIDEEYNSLGIPTISIKGAGSIEAAVVEAKHILSQSKS